MQKATIRDLQKSDLELRVQLLNDPAVREYLNVEEIFNIEDTTKWFLNIDKSNRFDCVFEIDGTPIGMGGLSNLCDGRGELYMYINPFFQGKGYGYLSLEALCNYGFNELGLSQIYLYTFSDNLRANNLYEKGGFIRDKNYFQTKNHNGLELGRYKFLKNKPK